MSLDYFWLPTLFGHMVGAGGVTPRECSSAHTIRASVLTELFTAQMERDLAPYCIIPQLAQTEQKKIQWEKPTDSFSLYFTRSC